MNSTRRPLGAGETYPAPTCPAAEVQGGIRLNAIFPTPGEGVQLRIVTPSNTIQGDLAYVYWGSKSNLVGIVPLDLGEGHAHVVTVNGALARLVTPENTRNPAVEAWYEVKLSDFADMFPSDRLSVNVDFQPPGGLVPPDHQASINPSLRRIPELDLPITPGQDLRLNVPNWEFMEAGDKLYLRWGSYLIGPTTISQGQVGLPVPITVPWSIISTIDGGRAIVDYYVEDLVGNDSRYSTGQRATNLPQPLIPEADDLFLDGGLASATLVVPSDATLLPGDMVEGFFAEQSLGAPRPATPGVAMSFTIPGTLIGLNQGNRVAAYYRVARAGATLESARFNVAVLPVTTPTFAPPDVPERNGNELDGTLSRATVRVLAATPLNTGDTVEAFFANTSLGSRLATPQANMDFTIPGATIAANQGNQVDARYTVTRAGVAYPSQALSISVTRPAAPEWDLEYNFDNDRIRDIGLREQLNFPETGTRVMNVEFDLREVTDTRERMGVESYAFTPTPEFKGKVLYVGNPTGTSHNNVFFVDLAEPWDVVRFMITSVNRNVTVSFKDSNLTVISGVITVPGGDVTRQHEVRYDDKGRRRIRHMEIRANDVVRFDTFKFRR